LGAFGMRLSRDLYLDLLERSLLNSIYGESRVETVLRSIWQRVRHPYLTRRGTLRWPSRAHSMIGEARMRQLRAAVETTISENIQGDYIETGVWRGGACILMRGILAAYGVKDRRVFCADSFNGLPRPNSSLYPADRRDRLFKFDELAVSEDDVRKNFCSYGLLDDQVVFAKGLFSESLPRLSSNTFAIIRLDGDMYESTMDAISNLYDAVSPGGFIIVDDYGGIKACKKAIHDFLDSRGLSVAMTEVDSSCVWWRKNYA